MNQTYADYGIDTKGRTSGTVKTQCPECSKTRKNKRDPCLSVDLDKQVWMCHHCQHKGYLKQEQEYCPPPVQKKGGEPETQPLTPDAIKWLELRGISKAKADEFNIKSTLQWFPQSESKEPAVAIPFYKNGGVKNVKIRSIKNKAFTQRKGGRQILFNYDNCIDQDDIVITEGELDAIAIRQAGFKGGVASCPNGAPAKGTKELAKKLEFIDDAKELFDRAVTVTLAMDNDEAGVPWAEAIAEKIGLEKCRIVTWPEGNKDANDVLMSKGAGAVADAVINARPFPVPGIVRYEEIESEIDNYYSQGGLSMGLSTGWRCMDDLLRLDTKTLNILTGIPSSGKSEWLDQLMLNTCREHGWRWAVFSPENYPLTGHFQKLAEKYTGKPMFRHYAMEPMSRDELQDAKQFINEHIINLTFGEKSASIDEIITRLKVCKMRWNIKACIIDPYNELDHTRPSGQTEAEYISDFLATLRNFGRLYDIAVWIVAHPTKLQKKDNGEYPCPTPYDISGAAHWRNKADVCIAVWRPTRVDKQDNNNVVDIHIQKVRNKNLGKTGTVKLQWTKANGLFTEHSQFAASDIPANDF